MKRMKMYFLLLKGACLYFNIEVLESVHKMRIPIFLGCQIKFYFTKLNDKFKRIYLPSDVEVTAVDIAPARDEVLFCDFIHVPLSAQG